MDLFSIFCFLLIHPCHDVMRLPISCETNPKISRHEFNLIYDHVYYFPFQEDITIPPVIVSLQSDSDSSDESD